ncbi:hypothetical protein, partial [Streptomyces sp. MBT33]|uniref:hypothetical protein n=1 Tax=Streptomyces sp. MBT33 TaxID=1488363 RepID=UPI001F28A971
PPGPRLRAEEPWSRRNFSQTSSGTDGSSPEPEPDLGSSDGLSATAPALSASREVVESFELASFELWVACRTEERT